jgi:hypothetical protein
MPDGPDRAEPTITPSSTSCEPVASFLSLQKTHVTVTTDKNYPLFMNE